MPSTCMTSPLEAAAVRLPASRRQGRAARARQLCSPSPEQTCKEVHCTHECRPRLRWQSVGERAAPGGRQARTRDVG
eukprot:10167334-Alexandrium_andersonii.AAC.1